MSSALSACWRHLDADPVVTAWGIELMRRRSNEVVVLARPRVRDGLVSTRQLRVVTSRVGNRITAWRVVRTSVCTMLAQGALFDVELTSAS
jgi:hypothetical protein